MAKRAGAAARPSDPVSGAGGDAGAGRRRPARSWPGWAGAIGIALLAAPTSAQVPEPAPAPTIAAPPTPLLIAPPVESPVEALIEDARDYARLFDLPLVEAARQLEVQQASVAFSDRLRAFYGDRLAGLFLQHRPDFRLVVLLAGDAPAPGEVPADGPAGLPVEIRTGAPATRAALLAAIRLHQADLRAAVAHPPGLGVDARRGRLVAMVRQGDLDGDAAALGARLSAIAGVPVAAVAWGEADQDLAGEGGGRVVGLDPETHRRGLCTGGFAVTDGRRTGLITAAHCPDALSLIEADAGEVPLTMIGAWGARDQDVQIHVGPLAFQPLFHPDAAKARLRPVTSWRNRESTRVGDVVCHRGERSGRSCAEVVYVDYAPPGDLCAGPCAPSWVAVRGPGCKGGDSGGPVFSGTIAFGIVKGDSTTDGVCRLYYYMSTDALPPEWRLLVRPG